MPPQTDLLRSPWAWLVWGLPIGVLVLGGIEVRVGGVDVPGNTWHTVLWTVGFAWIGVGCLVNARRCHRRHCYYTGPLYLGLAAASLTYGLGVLPLGRHGWGLIAVLAILGALLFGCVLEKVSGRYRTGP